MKKTTMKEFREKLNKENEGTLYKYGKSSQRKGGYGDYLYFQDREKFNILYSEFCEMIKVFEGMERVNREYEPDFSNENYEQ